MKSVSIPLVLLAMASAALANTAPTVVIQSATMRPGTTLMDVVYRVNDPDDATVKTRALAFVDGVRSFANVIRPVTFVEGTAAKLGDAIPANVDHTLTWDVATDWNVDLGQVKFEVLAMDGRGLLPLDWITIPAIGGKPALTISKNTPLDASVLDAFFWQYADGDPWLTLTNGILKGNAGSGVFLNVVLVSGNLIQGYGAAYIFKRMNLDPADSTDMGYAVTTARSGILSTSNWHAINRPYTGVSRVIAWGSNTQGESNVPPGLNGVTAIAVGQGYSLALKSDGTVVGWGNGRSAAIPAGLSGLTAIAVGDGLLALKSDGTVIRLDAGGGAAIPAGLNGVTAIAANTGHNLALKSDGTVVGWGSNSSGQTTIPAGLSGVIAIAAGYEFSLALKSDGTVVGWGSNGNGQTTPPAGLAGVTAIATGENHSLALKGDGTVVGWGIDAFELTPIPAGLNGVAAVASGFRYNLALKDDGTVVQWGIYFNGDGYVSATAPTGLNNIKVISVGGSYCNHAIGVMNKAP